MTTIIDISRTLPNGFHDAEIYGMAVDYIACEARLDFGILVGLLPLPERGTNVFQHVYRRARLVLSGVEYLAMEPPQEAYNPDDAPMVTSDGDDLSTTDPHLPDLEQPTAFRHWFFVSQWNTLIYVAATDARLDWEPEPPTNPV